MQLKRRAKTVASRLAAAAVCNFSFFCFGAAWRINPYKVSWLAKGIHPTMMENYCIPEFVHFLLLANSTALDVLKLALNQLLTAQRRRNVPATSNNPASFPFRWPKSLNIWPTDVEARRRRATSRSRRLIGRHRLILADGGFRSEVFQGPRQLRFIKLHNFVKQIKERITSGWFGRSENGILMRGITDAARGQSN